MHSDFHVQRIGQAGHADDLCRVADEVPVALSYNGFPYAVLMATPFDLQDLARGFSITDGICTIDEITLVGVAARDTGLEVNITLTPPALKRFLRDRRQRSQHSFTSCGLCGIETLAQLPTVPQHAKQSGAAYDGRSIRAALAALADHQTLNRLTGAVHAAAWASHDGAISLVREDVGRHNALDKLIGALASPGFHDPAGFCIVTSRCSYEMVQKAAAAGMHLLVALSAPTSLAIREARKAGLILVALARHDSQTVYAGKIEGGCEMRDGSSEKLLPA